MKNKTMRLAFGGILAALSIALISLLGMTALDLTAIAVCSFLTMLVMVECGEKLTWVYAAVTSVLALIIMPFGLVTIEYVLFAALYPILKMYFEKLRAMFAWLLKVSLFDSMLLLCLVLGEKVFVGTDYFPMTPAVLLFGTLFFVLYDFCLTGMISMYIVKLRGKIRGIFTS